jgi:hypothetical protein
MPRDNNRFLNKFLPQLVLQGRIKENAAGGETISFIIPLGPLQLICIANVPGEDDRSAPVYVKFKTDTRKTQTWINNQVANWTARSNGRSDDEYDDYPDPE